MSSSNVRHLLRNQAYELFNQSLDFHMIQEIPRCQVGLSHFGTSCIKLAAFLNDEIVIEFWTLNGLNNFLAFS